MKPILLKLAAVALAVVMACTLAACGGGGSSSSASPGTPAAKEFTAFDDDYQRLQDLFSNYDFSAYTDAERSEFSELKAQIESAYQAGDRDALYSLTDLFFQLDGRVQARLSQAHDESASAYSGIIVSTVFEEHAVTLNTIDPDTGAVGEVVGFTLKYGQPDAPRPTPILTESAWGGYFKRIAFDEHFTRMAVIVPKEGGFHAGWIDPAGTFVDATEIVNKGSGWGDPPKDMRCAFGQDGFFYFQSTIPSAVSNRITRIPVDNPTKENAEIIKAEIERGQVWLEDHEQARLEDERFFQAVCGSWKNPLSGFFNSADDGSIERHNPYIKSRTPAEWSWVSENTFVEVVRTVGNDTINGYNIMLYEVSDTSRFPSDWPSAGYDGSTYLDGIFGNEMYTLLPESHNKIWEPIASHDGARLAFFADANGATALYTVPIEGGEPILIKTDDQYEKYLPYMAPLAWL